MQTVAELMGDGHDVTQVVIVIAQNVWMQSRLRRSAECTAAFAFANLGVDPIFIKKFRGDLTKLRIESVERCENHLARVMVRKWFNFFTHRRVLVIERKTRKLEQFGF